MGKSQELGIFRFSIIAPLINKTHGFNTDEEYLSFASNKKYVFNNKECIFSKSCIKKWYQQYKKNGIISLEGKTREDLNTSRKLSIEAINRMIELRKEFPKITGTKIYEILISENIINKNDISLSTILRYLKKNNLKATIISETQRKMFEMENVNDCWQSDTSYGPYILLDGKKYRTYIMSIIDDKSRLIVGFDVFLHDNSINYQKVLKNAIKTYGKPKKLFVDNGATYVDKQLSYICATLGIELIHAKPYTPEAKAKQERFFRTIKDGWMNCTNWNEFKNLEDVKVSLSKFLFEKYINKVHSVTKETPNDRWHKEYEKIIYFEESFVDKSFLHRGKHKVRADSTIKFNNEFYEVPYEYVGRTIQTRYNPLNKDILYLYENDECKETIKIVDKITNSKIKRKQNIDYSQALNKESDVIESE